MAATGTPTPNLGLRIPVGTDPASVDDINYNSNLLDTVLGAVGNTSVKDQLDGLSDQIANLITVKSTPLSVETNASGFITLGINASYCPVGLNIPGYIVIPYRDNYNTWYAKVFNAGTMAPVAQGISISGTLYYV